MQKKCLTLFSMVTIFLALVACGISNSNGASEISDVSSTPISFESNFSDVESESESVGSSEGCEHVYDNACDIDCNVCGVKRTAAEHVYDGEYDKTCNECGFERNVSEDPVNGGNWTGEVPLK